MLIFRGFMRDYKFFFRLDWRIIPVILLLMIISLLVISSTTMTVNQETLKVYFFTPLVKSQIQWFILGLGIFLFFTYLDYHKLAHWSYIFYFGIIILLLGLFFVNPIQSVHRWYRLGFIGLNVQPSEYAKLIVVITLGSFLESRGKNVSNMVASLQSLMILGVPFLLILKEPDLGTALVLYPIGLVMFYFGGINKKIFRVIAWLGIVAFVFVTLMFLGVFSHEKMQPFFHSFLKPYQYERLNPNTYHQNASQTAIAIGGLTGTGWHKSEFSSGKWLPAAHTDSIFSAFGEEFGFLGMLFLLFLFYSLIYFSFRVVAVAKDPFGKLLASGIAVYLAMHIIVNIAMMCGFLPISGVPLILITYGGNSVVTTMAALGILQSIYVRRFMF